MTDTDEKPLTHTQYELLKAIPHGKITMTLAIPGSWRHTDGYPVTQSMIPLLQRKLVAADPTFTDGRRGCHLTQAGYAALSAAHRHRPKKKRR